MQLPKSVQKYYSKQNLTNWKIELNKSGFFNNIIIVPALNELINVQNLIQSLLSNSQKYLSDTLIIFVVNNLDTEKDEIIEENKKLLKYLSVLTFEKTTNLNLGFVDACSNKKALTTKNGGVGLARKIGMDLALSYFNYTNDFKKILISLDADCTVSTNYLESIVEQFNKKSLHSAIISFEHVLPKNENHRAAIINYEIFLRYYVLGLKHANSHFAFPSVGSTIVCDIEGYMKVGGMNKRKAGEDFYFLQKLAKIYKIDKVVGAIVFPSARISTRVPFGTGPRIKRFLDNTKNEYLLYSPKIFVILKKWLEVLDDELIRLTISKSWVLEIMQKAKEISPDLYNFLVEQNFENNWKNILQNSKSAEQIQKQKLNWMDGFRTLKLIHYLRDNAYPNQEMFSAVDDLLVAMRIKSELKTAEQIPTIKIQLKYLELLRTLT